MIKTHPGLRDMLRDRCALGGEDKGYYDGVAAMTFVDRWCKKMHGHHPHHDFYQKCLETILKMTLPSGCSERDFLAISRRLVYDVNPHLRAPCEGEALGELLIMKVMPNAYQDAAERLLDEMRANKELNDANKVIDRISHVISRRSRSTGEAHAAKVEAMLGFTENCNNQQEEEGDALAFNRNPGKAKVYPKRNIFCRKCPHKGKDGTAYDCLGDPRKTFADDHFLLIRTARNDPNLEKLSKRRDTHAKELGIVAKPLPKITLKPKEKEKGQPQGLAEVEFVQLVADVEAGQCACKCGECDLDDLESLDEADE